MGKLTGKLLEIAQHRVLEELSSGVESDDMRFAFWNEDDSRHQSERKLAKAQLIDSIDDLEILRDALGNPDVRICGIDVETTGLNYWEHEILGVGFALLECDEDSLLERLDSNEKHDVDEFFTLFYVNLNSYPDECKGMIEGLADVIFEVQHEIKWVLHNSKFDQHWFKQKMNLYLENVDDSLVMAYVLGEKHKAIDKLAPIYLGRFPHTLKEYLGKDSPTPDDMLSIPKEWLADYCVEDCLEGVCLSLLFMERLTQKRTSHGQPGYPDLWSVYQYIDLYCIKSLLWAEEVGVLLDWDKLSGVGVTLDAELYGIECEIAETLGKTVEEANKLCQSPRELSNYLYEEQKLPTDKITPTKFGFSTAVTALEELRNLHPLPRLILEHRKVSKVNGTYIKGFYQRGRNRRLHTTLNNTLTDTGRLSSSNPNLQNIPNPALSPTGKLIRQCFIAEEGNVLVKADYSQFELRILAHFSQDPYLLDCYRTGLDVHSVVTCLLFDHKYEDLDPDNNPEHKTQRRLTKTINFGLIYGMTGHRLLNESRKAGLKYTFEQCEELMGKYWSKLSGVAEWMAYVKLKAIRDGYTETLFGRRRYFEFHNPYLKSLKEKVKGMDLTLSNWKVLEAKGVLDNPKDAEALRACGNAPIQGSNADAIRIASGRLYECFYHSPVKYLLQVHDEIVLECPWKMQEEVKDDLVEIMTDVVKLSVPVEVEPKCALTWGDT